ncbi:hypothetical protein VdG1_09014 [Verticillium dahliae VDG1]|nr:hypothetical protein VdG1_09014 [Verticillium dahliae VDG1]
MNPRFGLDAQGGSPPDAPLGGQMYAPGQPYIPHHGMGSYGLGHTPYGGYGGYTHTKIHVFKTPTPPWQLPPSTGIEFHASHVPVTTTLAEILKGFGASGPTPKKNRCYEIAQAGNGRWYKGLSFGGDEKDMMKKSIKEIGWDETRNGQPGGKPVVCLWLTKDG